MTREQERLATEGLAYLLGQSNACSTVIRQVAALAGCNLGSTIRYRAEAPGEDLARPDVVGCDAEEREVVVIEGKFGAGLTENQPAAYLARLGSSRPGILVFVVPEQRLPRLWALVKQRTSPAGPDADTGPGRSCAIGPRQTLAMISWRQLLDLMLLSARSAGDPIVGDIQQLQNLCMHFEGAAFLPFRSGELSGLQLPQRHSDLCNIVDSIVSQLAASGEITTDGLRATPQRLGYDRYVRLKGDRSSDGVVTIGLMYDVWREHELSPLWLAAHNPRVAALLEEVALTIGSAVVVGRGRRMLPLSVEAELEREEIVDRCVLTITRVAKRFRDVEPVDGALSRAS
jgi:hypothetical protein